MVFFDYFFCPFTPLLWKFGRYAYNCFFEVSDQDHIKFSIDGFYINLFFGDRHNGQDVYEIIDDVEIAFYKAAIFLYLGDLIESFFQSNQNLKYYSEISKMSRP